MEVPRVSLMKNRGHSLREKGKKQLQADRAGRRRRAGAEGKKDPWAEGGDCCLYHSSRTVLVTRLGDLRLLICKTETKWRRRFVSNTVPSICPVSLKPRPPGPSPEMLGY